MPFGGQFRSLVQTTGQPWERCSPGSFCAWRTSHGLECCTGQLPPPETTATCFESLGSVPCSSLSLAQPCFVPAFAPLAPLQGCTLGSVPEASPGLWLCQDRANPQPGASCSHTIPLAGADQTQSEKAAAWMLLKNSNSPWEEESNSRHGERLFTQEKWV